MKVHGYRRSEEWGCHKLILSSDLISPEHGFIENDTVSFQIRAWIDGNLKHNTFTGGVGKNSVPGEERMRNRKEELSIDLGRMFKESVMTDITISSNGNRFHAHKAVLSGEYF